ncbi:MAG: sulfatase-like hydrolase/transferase [Pirellulaceae bacterium]
MSQTRDVADGATANPPPRPNIVLIMADDMGWGDPSYQASVGAWASGAGESNAGWIQTPALDDMAAHGLRFDRFYSASAVCSPTRGSCLTGRHPTRLGIPTANAGRLEFDERSLPRVLSEAGYRCGHFGKWHLGTLTTLRRDSNRGGLAEVDARFTPRLAPRLRRVLRDRGQGSYLRSLHAARPCGSSCDSLRRRLVLWHSVLAASQRRGSVLARGRRGTRSLRTN